VSAAILPIEELRRLPACDDFDGGVYFLWLGEALQYIGKSRQICNRLNHHQWARQYAATRSSGGKVIPYDRHTCLVVHSGRLFGDRKALDQKLNRLERLYIAAYRPPFNSISGGSGRCA
jgi:hypothetical protein